MMKTKTIKTLKAVRNILKKTLPEKISKVLNSYENFADHEAPEDAKGFSSYHLALKSAILHAETLLKLAKWTDETAQIEQKNDSGDDILKILAEARSAKKLEDDEDGED